jgi:hypothetical protein
MLTNAGGKAAGVAVLRYHFVVLITIIGTVKDVKE